jgi:hypothetical protein
MFRQFICLSASALLIVNFAGCKSNQQQESGAQSQTGSTAMKQLPAGEIEYIAPENWMVQQPSSSMRKAEFSLPGVEGDEAAELAVFFFPGTGGSVQANLDRWYGQFKQPDGSATKDHAKTQDVDVNGLQVTVVHVTGTYLKSQSPMMMGGPVEEMPNYAMLAAIVETANGPWFFKATGPQKTVDHWLDSFDEFVRSFRVKKEGASE